MVLQEREKSWIEERRSVLVKEIVRQMLWAKLFFDDLFKEFQTTGELSFQLLDRWIGTEANRGSLWNLKEDSHLLFRKNSTSSFYERVFDWTLGSIFHEGMKLKENVYLLEVYQRAGKAFTENGTVPEDFDIQSLREEYEITLTKARDSATDDVKNLQYLFSKAMEQLQWLMCGNKHEGLLIRYLIEDEETYERVYGAGSLEKLFTSMYKRGVAEAYFLAAKNYREGGWHEKALTLLQKALEIAPEDGEFQAECQELEDILAKE
jgi:hypothetical protein